MPSNVDRDNNNVCPDLGAKRDAEHKQQAALHHDGSSSARRFSSGSDVESLLSSSVPGLTRASSGSSLLSLSSCELTLFEQPGCNLRSTSPVRAFNGGLSAMRLSPTFDELKRFLPKGEQNASFSVPIQPQLPGSPLFCYSADKTVADDARQIGRKRKEPPTDISSTGNHSFLRRIKDSSASNLLDSISTNMGSPKSPLPEGGQNASSPMTTNRNVVQAIQEIAVIAKRSEFDAKKNRSETSEEEGNEGNESNGEHAKEVEGLGGFSCDSKPSASSPTTELQLVNANANGSHQLKDPKLGTRGDVSERERLKEQLEDFSWGSSSFDDSDSGSSQTSNQDTASASKKHDTRGKNSEDDASESMSETSDVSEEEMKGNGSDGESMVQMEDFSWGSSRSSDSRSTSSDSGSTTSDSDSEGRQLINQNIIDGNKKSPVRANCNVDENVSNTPSNEEKESDREYIKEEKVRPWDVFAERGGKANNNPGNKRYLNLVYGAKCKYRTLQKKKAKTDLSAFILDFIESKDGRFLKKAKDGRYFVMARRDARDKVAQALREVKDEDERAFFDQLQSWNSPHT